MPYEFSLSELEASDEFSQSSPEVQRAISREYISQNGADEVLQQFQAAVSDPEYQSLQPEQQQLFRKSYQDFYGIDLPLEDVSFGTDVKDVVMSGLAGTSAIPKAAATVAGWFGAEDSKESLLDIAKTTEDFYTSRISKQGKEVQEQSFLSDQDGKWFGDNAVKKVFMASAESLPLMVATAPIGGALSAGISKATFLPSFIRAVEGGSKVGQWSHNLITFGASEAGTSALVSAADAGERIEKMPDSVIAKSPVYQELLKQGMDPAAARAELRGIVEEETVKTQFAATLAGSAVAPGGGMAKLFQRGPRAGVIRETGEGIVTEGLQEAGQSGLEQLGENVTTQRNLDPNQSLTENVGESMALGGASGGLMGGGMSGGSKLLTLGQAQQIAQNIPLNADPEQVVAQIETATNPTAAPGITLGELTPDEIEGIAAVQTRYAGADMAEIQRVQRDVLPMLREKNPMVAPHVERIISERAKVLQAEQARVFEQQVPAVEANLAGMQPDLAADDLMDDWAESEQDVQAQADARSRSVRFEQLKQRVADRVVAADELAQNTVGRPSTAEESAAVLAEAGPTEIEQRAARQGDIEKAFAESEADDLVNTWADDAVTLQAGEDVRRVTNQPEPTAPVPDENLTVPGSRSMVPDQPTVKPFEQAQKDDIYTTKIGNETRFAIRGENPRGGGDELFKTYEEAETSLADRKKRDTANAEFQARQNIQIEKEAEQKRQAEDLDEFDSSMTPMQRGRVISALSKQVNYGGRVLTKRDLIRDRVDAGYTVDEDGNLADPDGSFLGPNVLTKTGIDYARHLIGRRNTAASLPAEESDGVPSGPVDSRSDDKTQTIAGKLSLSEFEQAYDPSEVTREDWVSLQRAERRRIGQDEKSGTAAAPYADYEEYHKQAVKEALDKGEDIDERVLADYPDLVADLEKEVDQYKRVRGENTANGTVSYAKVGKTVSSTEPLITVPSRESRTIPVADSKLETVGEIEDRIQSIYRQISKLDNAPLPRVTRADYQSDRTAKYRKFNERLDALEKRKRELPAQSIAADQPVNTEPTEKQAEAGNYRKAHVTIDGLNLSIENPVGSTRRGTDTTGRAWSQDLTADYGYIKGTRGRDKDHVDIFVKPGYTGGAADVFVVNQYKPDGTFDEHKSVIGVTDETEALELYNSNYESGWTGGRSVTRVPLESFKKWVSGHGPSKGPLVRRGTVTDQDVARQKFAEKDNAGRPETVQGSTAKPSGPGGGKPLIPPVAPYPADGSKIDITSGRPIELNDLEVGEKITFSRGGREYTERILKVMPADMGGPLAGTYQVDLFGIKYIKPEEITRVTQRARRPEDDTIEPAPTITSAQTYTLGNPDPAEAAQVQTGVDGKSVTEAAQFLIDTAPDRAYRLIAEKTRDALRRAEDAGVKFDTVKVAHVGDDVPLRLVDSLGVTSTFFDSKSPRVEVWLNGADVIGKVGTTYETALHELIHAATQAEIYLGTDGNSRHVSDLFTVANQIVEHLNNRLRDFQAGKTTLTDFERNVISKNFNTVADAHEVLTWTLSNRDMQRYLEGIKIDKTDTLWSKFITSVRQFLGLTPSSDTALSEVLRVGEEIFKLKLLRELKTFTPTMVPQTTANQITNTQTRGASVQLTNEDNTNERTEPSTRRPTEKTKRPTTETGRGLRGHSPAFRRWFGASRITDQGAPVILYHGTPDPDFLSTDWTFDLNRPARPGSSPLAALGAFLGDETIADAHSVGTEGTTHAFYVRIENPYVVQSDRLERVVVDGETARALRTRLIAEGYDGLIIEDRAQVVIFDPNQVKSAERNSGAYSREIDSVLEAAAYHGSPRSSGDGNFNYVIFNDADVSITDILESPTTRREFIKQGGALIAWAAAGGDILSAAPRPFNEAVRDPEQTVHGLLENIRDNSTSQRFREMAEDLLTLLPESDRLSLTVTDTRTSAAGIAKTDRAGKRIDITLYGDGHNEATLLHESWHAAVLARYDMLNYYLANPGKMGNHHAEAALKQYRAVWEEFQAEVNRYGRGRTDLPVWLRVPAENPDEFLTYALTNQETIDWMSEREYKGKTLRERFLQAIRGFFARMFPRRPTWLEAANMAAGDLIEAMKKDAPNFEASARVLALAGKSGGSVENVAKAAREIRGEPAFKKWFEGSKVVDGNGEPLVVYHQTNQNFTVFDPKKSQDFGIHFGSEQQAKSLAGDKPGTLHQVYLNISNPLELDFDPTVVGNDDSYVEGEYHDKILRKVIQAMTGKQYAFYEGVSEQQGKNLDVAFKRAEKADVLVAELLENDDTRDTRGSNKIKNFHVSLGKLIESFGYDGVFYENEIEGSGVSYIAFKPTQIKSIFNRGNWSPTNPDILESTLYAPSPTATQPDAIDRFLAKHPNLSDQWERFLYSAIDKDDPRRRVLARADVVNLSENLSENTDILTIERLRGKKTADEAEQFMKTTAEPLLMGLARNRLAAADLDEYAHAKHAPERNKRMQQVNAKRFIDMAAQHLNSAERAALDERLIDIRSDVLMTGGTRADRQDRYLDELDDLFTGIAAQQADVATQQRDRIDNRTFTAAEIAKGTPVNIQAELDARSKHLDEIERVRDRWERESPRFAGITDAEAAVIVRKWQADPRFAALQTAHQQLLDLGQLKLDILRESGQLSDVEYRSLVDGYEFYVPLHRDIEDDTRPATGRVTGPTGSPIKVAKGSMLEVVHILAHSIQNVQTAITRKHKADAGRVLVNFARENPDAGITVGKQAKNPTHDADGNIVMYTAPKEADNELYIRVDGERFTLSFDTKNLTTKRFLKSIKNADANLSGPMAALSRMIRILAMVNTTLSPEFVLSNFTRDIQTAGVHMEDTDAKGLQMRVLKNVFPAIRGIFGAEYGKASTYWGKVYRDFAANGGKIGWMQSYDGIKDLAKQIESTMDLYRDGHIPKKALRVIGDAISRTNTAVENGVRLAFYDQMIKSGATPSKAALTASNLTVDFTRRGADSPAINALYMFFNAGVQGNVRMIKAVTRSPRVRAIVGGIVVTGAALQLLAYATGGDDETGQPFVDGIPDFIRERNIIIMIPDSGGKFVKIPMPYGYNLFYNLGGEVARAFHSAATGRKYDAAKAAMRTVTMAMNSFNPLQAATVTQALAPTVVDPFVMVGENKTWSGSDLMPKESPFGPGKADAYRYWKSTSGIAKNIAQGLHRLTGGTGEYDNTALVDISPEVIELMYETITGSAGRFLKDSVVTPIQAITGDEPVESSKIPFVRRVYGKWSNRSISERYYESAEQVERFRKNYLAADTDTRKKMASDPRYKMVSLAKDTENTLTKLREARNKAEAARRPTKLIEEKIVNVQTEYLKRSRK